MREVKNLFVRTNTLGLLRKFLKCSVSVKIVLFKSFCLSFYDVVLWKSYKVVITSVSFLLQCVILFSFQYRRYDSVTGMLFELDLSSFDALFLNSERRFETSFSASSNTVITALSIGVGAATRRPK